MLIVGVMNGYSSSSTSTRTGAVVAELLSDRQTPHELLELKSHVVWSSARKMTKWLNSRLAPSKTYPPPSAVLLVGKSLGAVHIIRRVLPRIHIGQIPLYLFTIDPNEPRGWDLNPNLNEETIEIPIEVTKAVNIYVFSHDQYQQCGARLNGKTVENLPVAAQLGYDHYSIVISKIVRDALWGLLREIEET